ncbi:MAG TPA: DUF4352 domain-containing protein [Ktedonobacteraceae bacterium]|nr:DUF4352 domain-containing protein [Ktedonobacteraceae bacterium]
MYQQPGDPNAQNQGSYYPPSSNPQWPNTSPGYAPSGSPSGTDQPSYAPPPPTPTYYPPTQLGAPPYSPQGNQQYGYPGGPGYMPPIPPRKSNTRMFVIIAVVLIAVLAIGGIGVVLGRQGGANTTTTTPTPATGTTPSTSGNTPITGDTPVSGTTPTSVAPVGNAKVGQVVQAGPNYAVTVNSVKTSTGDDISQPKTGNIYIVLDVTVKNTSTSPQDVSSFINFELQDTTGQKYDTAFTDIGTPPDQTGLQPGKLIRGQLVYEVPSSLHQFTFSYLDFLANGTLATWDITD